MQQSAQDAFIGGAEIASEFFRRERRCGIQNPPARPRRIVDVMLQSLETDVHLDFIACPKWPGARCGQCSAQLHSDSVPQTRTTPPPAPPESSGPLPS